MPLYKDPTYPGPNYGQSNRRSPQWLGGYSGYSQGDSLRTEPVNAPANNPTGGGNPPASGGLPFDPGGDSLADLYARMGFGESTYRGDNPGLSIISKMTPALGARILSQIGFGNSLEGRRQSAITALIRALSPGGKDAKVAAYGTRAQQNARDSVRNAPTGYGSGFTEGLERDAYNRAAESTRDFDAHLSGPGGDQESLAAILSAISGGQATDLDSFLAMTGLAEQNNQFRQSIKGQGSALSGLSGILGQLGGAYLGGMGGGGGGNPLADWLAKNGVRWG